MVVGGSYPGALAAWFRYKYPHLTVGGWSSSGVVESIADYVQYDGQVRDDLMKSGDACYDNITSIIKTIEGDIAAAKTAFGVDAAVPDDEFLMNIGDVVAVSNQYSDRVAFCEYVIGKPTMNDLAEWSK